MSADKVNPKEFRMNHLMLRIKDPKISLPFYTDVLGMEVIDEHDGGDFKLFFLAYGHQSSSVTHRAQREGIVELTWNKGTESKEGQVYTNGNEGAEKQGFGHICVSVPNLQDAVAHFDKHGTKFKKRPEDGKMRHIAFIYDPDNYVSIADSE